MSRLAGKVALITGAARGQGRGHALRLARDGADIVALDICAPIGSVAYPLASPEDLDRTVAEVEALDRRIVAVRVDVRDATAVREAVATGVERLGGLDIVLANAGIGMTDPEAPAETAFRDVLDVNLVGVWNTVHAAAPTMIEQGRGGAVVLTGSVMGLTPKDSGAVPGTEGYIAAKCAIVGFTKAWAHWLAPHRIRVNSVHPTGVNTPMIVNDALQAFFAALPADAPMPGNLLDVDMIEVEDVSNAVAWLVSDEARYVTGVALPVDAGFTVK